MTDVSAAMSEERLQRAARTDAWAATRNAIREIDPANVEYPQYVSRAQGPYVWDTDGNRYLDFILGYGPVVLGHADARVNAAVTRELARGVCISPMWSERQYELTELLTEVVHAEQAYLMRTGSDATAAAVRLARIYTGRRKVLKWGYNGWHDWTTPRPAGVPPETTALVLHFTYNDLASVEEAFARNPGEIACVIMMPFELELPHAGFLHGVREIAHHNGALFIIDDMRSGFRVALGGAQEYFNITADLATFSKAMANGYAISAVAGRADILAGLAQTHMSSTFFANPPEMAAAIETISILRAEGIPARIWELARRFHAGLHGVLSRHDVPVTLEGYPISPLLEFREDGTWSAQAARKDFYRYTLSRGVLFHPNHQWYLSASHTEEEIDRAIDVCDAAFSFAFNRRGG